MPLKCTYKNYKAVIWNQNNNGVSVFHGIHQFKADEKVLNGQD
jgi:hypothetical protein